jgi:hypothetical protein
MKQKGSIGKKIENLMLNVTIILSDKLQKCWLCRHTFMANSPLAVIGDRFAHPGYNAYEVNITIRQTFQFRLITFSYIITRHVLT